MATCMPSMQIAPVLSDLQKESQWAEAAEKTKVQVLDNVLQAKVPSIPGRAAPTDSTPMRGG